MRKVIEAAIVGASLMLPSAAMAFDLQGHRGARGLVPENTLEAFTAALAIGVTTLELDLAMTKDGVLVVSHDSRLNPDHTRGPDGKFLDAEGPAIRSLTLDELKRYDVGRLKPGTLLRGDLLRAARDGRRPHPDRWRRCSIWCARRRPTTSASISKPS